VWFFDKTMPVPATSGQAQATVVTPTIIPIDIRIKVTVDVVEPTPATTIQANFNVGPVRPNH
jgi:hypothetical protein